MFTNTVPATGLAAVYSPFTGRTCVMYWYVIPEIIDTTCDQVQLYAHATNTCACDVFGHHFHFDAFSTVFDHPHFLI